MSESGLSVICSKQHEWDTALYSGRLGFESLCSLLKGLNRE